MNLYVNLDTQKIVLKGGTNLPVGNLTFVRGDKFHLDVYFYNQGAADSSDIGSIPIAFGGKESGKFDSDYLFYSDTYTKLTIGDDTVYRFTLDLNTTQLNGALEVDSVTTNDVSQLNANIEIQWTSGDLITSTVRQSAIVQNDVNKGTEGLPTEGNPSYATTGALASEIAARQAGDDLSVNRHYTGQISHANQDLGNFQSSLNVGDGKKLFSQLGLSQTVLEDDFAYYDTDMFKDGRLGKSKWAIRATSGYSITPHFNPPSNDNRNINGLVKITTGDVTGDSVKITHPASLFNPSGSYDYVSEGQVYINAFYLTDITNVRLIIGYLDSFSVANTDTTWARTNAIMYDSVPGHWQVINASYGNLNVTENLTGIAPVADTVYISEVTATSRTQSRVRILDADGNVLVDTTIPIVGGYGKSGGAMTYIKTLADESKDLVIDYIYLRQPQINNTRPSWKDEINF